MLIIIFIVIKMIRNQSISITTLIIQFVWTNSIIMQMKSISIKKQKNICKTKTYQWHYIVLVIPLDRVI